MNQSGSLCPAIKAADVIGDKWTLLILRELFLGQTRYGEFQRALPRISPTILSKRLRQLEADGLIVRKPGGGKVKEYRLTRCGREVGPIIEHLSHWGLRWARRQIQDEDMDVSAFMWDYHRTLVTDELPDGETVIHVRFPELASHDQWWLIASQERVELCTDDPGREPDLWIEHGLAAAAAIWMGDVDARAAVRAGDVVMRGPKAFTQTISHWFPTSRYSEIRPEVLKAQ